MKRRGLLLALLTIAALGANQLIATGATTRAGKFSYVSKSFSVGARAQSKLQIATCPPRTHVYGGGAAAALVDGVVNASFPIDNGDRGKAPDDGWAVYYDNYENGRINGVDVRAICGPMMPRYRSTGFVVAGGRYVTARVACPRGTFLWGGGASNRGPWNTMYLSESGPYRKRKWESTVANISDRRYSGVAYSICGRKRPVYEQSSTSVPDFGRVWDADCPTQLHHAISGGVTHTGPGRIGINGLFPVDSDGNIDAAYDDGYEANLDNYVTDTKRMTVTVVCLVR